MMARLMIARLILAAAAIAPGLAGVSAREQTPAEERYFRYDAAKLRGCDDANVLGVLMARFESTQSEYWQSDLKIVQFTDVRTTHFRPNGLDLIPRRYCSGTVVLNNHKVTPVYYVLTQDGGMAGHAYGLQFCVQGYDRSWAYAPNCKMARP